MELFTRDLLLRTVDDNDIEEVSRMWDFENGVVSLKDAQTAINNMKSNHARNGDGIIYHLCFAVFHKGNEKIIGWCGLDGKIEEAKLHIFYSIDPDFRNQGYATQCAERLLSYAFNEAHVPFINGGCDKDNTASFRVMTKIGMTQNAFKQNGDPLFFIDKFQYQFNATIMNTRENE